MKVAGTGRAPPADGQTSFRGPGVPPPCACHVQTSCCCRHRRARSSTAFGARSGTSSSGWTRTHGRIGRAWRRLLRRLNPSRDDYDTLAAMDLAACYRHLSPGGRAGTASGDEAYRLAIERGARTLMRSDAYQLGQGRVLELIDAIALVPSDKPLLASANAMAMVFMTRPRMP